MAVDSYRNHCRDSVILSPAAYHGRGRQSKEVPAMAVAQEAGDEIELDPGVTVTVLASEAVDSLPGDETDFLGHPIALSQVPLPPGTTMSEVLTGPLAGPPEGLQLLYVDVGELIVLSGSGESTYQRGAQLLIPSGTDFDVRNDTSNCASFLLLTVALGAVAGDSVQPSLDQACLTSRIVQLRVDGTIRAGP